MEFSKLKKLISVKIFKKNESLISQLFLEPREILPKSIVWEGGEYKYNRVAATNILVQDIFQACKFVQNYSYLIIEYFLES